MKTKSIQPALVLAVILVFISLAACAPKCIINGRVVDAEAGHSQDQHASFTVLVAEEVTESKHSPFYNAIMPLFKRWRDNLREQFRKTFGQQQSPEPN